MNQLNKIVFFTSGRSDYDLIKNLIFLFSKNKYFKTHLLIAGTHSSNTYGNTDQFILKSNSIYKKKIKVKYLNESPSDIIFSSSDYLLQIQNYISQINPDIFVFLGDRYETFISAYCAFINRCKIIHLHGGELTFSLYDDALRHSISKFSHLHFVSHKTYKNRVLQLGEDKRNVFNVGAFGVENIKKRKKNLKVISEIVGFDIRKNKYILVCFHPETLKGSKTIVDFKILIESIIKFKDYNIVFNIPNNDAFSKSFIDIIDNKIKENDRFFLVKSLGSSNFFSLMEQSSLFIGNSSSE